MELKSQKFHQIIVCNKYSSNFCCVHFLSSDSSVANIFTSYSLCIHFVWAKYHHNFGSQFIKFDQKIGLVAYAPISMFTLLFKVRQPITNVDVANAVAVAIVVECRHRCDKIYANIKIDRSTIQ